MKRRDLVKSWKPPDTKWTEMMETTQSMKKTANAPYKSPGTGKLMKTQLNQS